MSTPGQASAESLLSAEKRTLEMIATKASLPDVLDDLCRAIDAHAPRVISTVALMDPDGRRLWLGAGPRFPAEVKQVAFPWPIGPNRGACGTAAFLKQRVIISDIKTDLRWPDDCRDFPVSHGLRAAWSEPLVSKDGTVLGTFAMYYAEPRVPDKRDLELIEASSHIALIAIQLERSQAALRESEERLRLAMEAGKSVGWDREVKSGRDSLFGDLRSIFGIPSEVFSGRVEDFHRYVHPEDRARVVEAVDHSMHTQTPYAAEFRIRWPDGTVRWLSANGKFHYSRDGEPERMLGMAIDITDRKLAEDSLRESEERFRLAAQVGRMYAFDWDVATDVIVRSQESSRIFGLIGEPIRLTKRELLARVHPEDQKTFINSLAECTPESPNTQISYRLLRPDGSVLWLERTGHAIFDEQGKMVRMIGMAADITQRKLGEAKLLEYERAVEGAEEMIVVVDREYRYLIANNTFLKMRKMTKAQVVGRFAHEVLNKGVFEALVKEKLDECFQGKVVKYEMKYTYPELGERDIFISYFPIEGTTGIDRVACIMQDITERKSAEEALSTVSQKLIEAQEEERARIARELHDDVGQRLALLAVHVEGLKQSSPAWGAESESQIGELRKQIADLSIDVQALSHELHSPKLEYLGLAAAAAGFCRELSDRQGVEIDFHSERIPTNLPKDVALCLFRVLQEALQNATKHSGTQQFQVSLRGGVNEVELTVHDSGIGFAPEEAMKGRGLGLTSMQERLKLVDGQLSIESRPGAGTTIRATAPRLGSEPLTAVTHPLKARTKKRSA
jgi:PAS domain S-box-containing protein